MCEVLIRGVWTPWAVSEPTRIISKMSQVGLRLIGVVKLFVLADVTTSCAIGTGAAASDATRMSLAPQRQAFDLVARARCALSLHMFSSFSSPRLTWTPLYFEHLLGIVVLGVVACDAGA